MFFSIQILNRTALNGWIRLEPSYRNNTTQNHVSNFVSSTMADNLRSKAKMLDLDTDSPLGIPDESKSASKSSILVPQLEVEASSEGGLHIFVSPTFSIPLFQLLCSLRRDIFYAIGRDDLHSTGGPFLALSVQEKYPLVWKPNTNHKKCRWLLIKAVPELAILKSPDDTPHWVNKTVNALESSGLENSKRDLCFNGKPLSLAMLKDVWMASGGAEGNSLCTNVLTPNHFDKTSYNLMRLYLAAEVVSNSMCRLIDEHAGDPELNSALRKVLACVDKIVDIFNGTKHNKKGDAKSARTSVDLHTLFCKSCWSTPHCLRNGRKRLARIGMFFLLPNSTYKDSCWMVFGLLVGMSQQYLKADKSRVLVQRRLSTTFGHFRANNPEFSSFEASRYAAAGTGQHLNASFIGRRTNNSQANTTRLSSRELILSGRDLSSGSVRIPPVSFNIVTTQTTYTNHLCAAPVVILYHCNKEIICSWKGMGPSIGLEEISEFVLQESRDWGSSLASVV
jgi:hypothetical protein